MWLFLLHLRYSCTCIVLLFFIEQRSAYQKLYETFLLENSDRFVSWKPFEHSKALGHRLQEYKLDVPFKKWCQSHMSFLDPNLNMQGAVLTMHTCVNVLLSSLKRFYDKQTISEVMLEVLKLTVLDSDCHCVLYACMLASHGGIDGLSYSFHEIVKLCVWN